MKVLDVVTRNEGVNVFVITEIKITTCLSEVTLVEVDPGDTERHLYPDAKPFVISIDELNKLYSEVD